jgi:hypothetical protein
MQGKSKILLKAKNVYIAEGGSGGGSVDDGLRSGEFGFMLLATEDSVLFLVLSCGGRRKMDRRDPDTIVGGSPRLWSMTDYVCCRAQGRHYQGCFSRCGALVKGRRVSTKTHACTRRGNSDGPCGNSYVLVETSMCRYRF